MSHVCEQDINLLPTRANITALYGDTLRSRFSWLIPEDLTGASFTLEFRDGLLENPLFLTIPNAELFVEFNQPVAGKTKVSMRNLTALEEDKWRESNGYISYALRSQNGSDIRTRFTGFFTLTDNPQDCPTTNEIEGYVIGVKGDAGQDGIDGGQQEFYNVPFSYGDASPVILKTPSKPSLLLGVTLSIRTAFNGLNPSLSVGTPGDPQRYVTGFENDPSLASEFYIPCEFQINTGTPIILAITPGGAASQGSGVVILHLIEQ